MQKYPNGYEVHVDVKVSGQVNCTVSQDEKGRELPSAQEKDLEIFHNLWKIKCLEFGPTELKFQNLFVAQKVIHFLFHPI